MAQFYLIFAFAVAFLGIAILLGFLFFLHRKQSRSRQGLRELAERLHGRVTGSSLFTGDLLEGLHGGAPFTCRYFMGSKNSPPSLTIQAKASCPAKLTIRREFWYDRFAKRIGLVAEIQTGDPAFDGSRFLDTDRTDIYLPYLSEAARRQQIDALFNLGYPAREIVFDRKGVRIVLSPVEGETLAAIPVENYLDGLIRLSSGIPASGLPALYAGVFGSAPPRKPIPLAGLILLFLFLGLLILGGAIALGYGMNEYEPVGNRLVLNALALSAPAALLFLALAFRWIRGRSSSHRVFLFVLLFSLIGFPLAMAGGAVMTNGLLDQGIETAREVPVTDRSYRQNKSSRTYFVSFPSWQHPGQTDRVDVDAAFYRAVRPGDRIVIRTRPGHWGEEWIAGIERTPTQTRREDAAAEIPLRLLGIRFYESGPSGVPKDERHYAGEFRRETARYIGCQVDMQNDLWRERDRPYTFGWKYLNPDGSLRGELSLPFTIRKEWQTAWVSHHWGWDDPGHWPPGAYRVVVVVDGRPLGEGMFDIR